MTPAKSCDGMCARADALSKDLARAHEHAHKLDGYLVWCSERLGESDSFNGALENLNTRCSMRCAGSTPRCRRSLRVRPRLTRTTARPPTSRTTACASSSMSSTATGSRARPCPRPRPRRQSRASSPSASRPHRQSRAASPKRRARARARARAGRAAHRAQVSQRAAELAQALVGRQSGHRVQDLLRELTCSPPATPRVHARVRVCAGRGRLVKARQGFRPPAHRGAGCATRPCATPAARPTASSAPAQRTVCRGELSREECPTGRALHGVHAHSARSGQSGGLSLRDASCEPPRNPPFYSTRRKSPKPFRSPAFRGRTLRRPGSGPPSAAPARPRILLQIGRSGGCLGPRLVISLAPTPRALIGWLLTLDCTTRVVLSALHWPDQPGPRPI